MTNAVLTFARALDFAAKKHVNQRRKGEAQEPYINHLADVTRLLAAATDGKDTVLVIAGLLHDTIEDTETTFEELETEFGLEVAELVAEVSDDKSLEKGERKRLQIVKAPTKSDRAKMLKIADKTSNLQSIYHSPPTDWNLERRQEYFGWALDVVAGCRGVNEYLEKAFDRAWERGMAPVAEENQLSKS